MKTDSVIRTSPLMQHRCINVGVAASQHEQIVNKSLTNNSYSVSNLGCSDQRNQTFYPDTLSALMQSIFNNSFPSVEVFYEQVASICSVRVRRIKSHSALVGIMGCTELNN